MTFQVSIMSEWKKKLSIEGGRVYKWWTGQQVNKNLLIKVKKRINNKCIA
jgi:hypothetical protein